MRKLIVNLTPTGMIPTKETSPHVPIAPAEIAADVDRCAALGVTMVHLHARDEEGLPSYHKEIYADIITRIRTSHPRLVLVASTSGRTFGDFSQRSEVLELESGLKPDMASLTLGSVNFSSATSVNSPDTIKRLAEKMLERGIKPELEVFDLGMVNYAHYLIRKGLLEPPYYFNIILGNVAAAQAKLLHVGLIVSELPPDSYWCLGGMGDFQSTMNALGIACGDGVRVGLEDNLFLDEERKELATNQAMIERIHRIANAMGRPVMTSPELRVALKLPS
jgi:3-keto-5-aminohexanoate cleavage enzyme